MYKRILLSIICCVSLQVTHATNTKLLEKLDNLIDRKSELMQKKELKIDSIKMLYKMPDITLQEQYVITRSIFREYKRYNYDKALSYGKKATEIANKINKPFYINENICDIAFILATCGMYKEAIERMEEIDESKNIDVNMKSRIYANYEWIYCGLKEFTNDSIFSPQYRELEYNYCDSVFRLLPPNGHYKQYYTAKMALHSGLLERSLDIYLDLLPELQYPAQYSVIAYRIAEIYRRYGNLIKYEEYLTKAAICDVENSLMENSAMQDLAIYIFKHKPKQLDRAYKYIKSAMEDACFFNNRLRVIQIADKMPIILKAYQDKSSKENKILTGVSGGLILLIIALLYLIYKIYTHNKTSKKTGQELEELNIRLQELNQKLILSNKTKEEYIGLFSDLCTTYIDKLNEFRVTVKRKIIAKQVDELYQMVNSTFSIEQELADFFDFFDTSFIKIFPNFVKEFNKLLLPDEQIELKQGEILNRDLRIYALIRLGISDSSKIASFLHYSPQTIYNNRTKVKSKAICKDTFDEDVIKIGEFTTLHK